MALVRFYKPTLRRRDMDAVLQTMVDEKIGPGERRKQFLKLMAEYLNLKEIGNVSNVRKINGIKRVIHATITLIEKHIRVIISTFL